MENEQIVVKDYNGWKIYKSGNRYYGKSIDGKRTFAFSSIDLVVQSIDDKVAT